MFKRSERASEEFVSTPTSFRFDSSSSHNKCGAPFSDITFGVGWDGGSWTFSDIQAPTDVVLDWEFNWDSAFGVDENQ
jgi:hypothetical protein